MGKRQLTTEEQLRKYKRRSFVLTVVLFLFTGLAGFYIYLNYDYLAFKHFITQHYIYSETLDELFKKELKRDVKGRYYSYFDDAVISIVTKHIREMNNDRYTYLYIPEHLQRYKQEEKAEAAKSELRKLTDATAYLHITNFSKHTEKFVLERVEELKSYQNIIIDLRDNLGGDIFAMNRISGLFLPKGSVITRDKLRIIDWIYKTRKPQALFYKNIIILQNKNSASASECFIGALKNNLENVTLIGEPTFGKGIGQYTMPLRRGFAVKATTMLWFTPDGQNVHEKGIAPDISYTEENIIDYALSKIQ